MDETRTLKVGEVAEAAGLTVRTLHHWDRIGLLSPSERSPAGHRGTPRPTWSGCTRCWPCAAWASGWSRSPSASTPAGPRTRRPCWTRSGRARRRPRRRASWPATWTGTSWRRWPGTGRGWARWPTTCWRSSGRSCTGGPSGSGPPGVPPDDPRLRRLVARIDELGARFSGGDRKLSAGVRAAWADDPAGLADVPAEQATSWGELARYLDLARRNPDTKAQDHA